MVRRALGSKSDAGRTPRYVSPTTSGVSLVRKLGGTIPEGSGFIFEQELISFREARWYDAFSLQKMMLNIGLKKNKKFRTLTKRLLTV